MKLQKIVLMIVLFTTYGCRENIIEFSEVEKIASIYVSSIPSGANIYLNEIRIGKTTPDSLINIQPGNYAVRLHLTGYQDYTVFLNIIPGQKKYINVNLN